MIIYVPKSITDAVKSRQDWPELEAAMKRAYGADWRLVSYDEMKYPAEAGEMEDSMENEYISRKELIVWLMPYVHTGEKVDPEVLLADIRAMKGADVVSVVHGVWEPIIDGFGVLEGWIHPECGRTTREASAYCPTCGAKMDKED